jgi:putative zinc finger protein
MSLSCRETRDLFPLYGAEALGRTARREVREHLAGCEPCRAQAGLCDEGLLFAFSEREDVTAQEVEQVLAGVRAGMDWKRVERRIAPSLRARGRARGRRGLLAAAAALVAFALAFPELSPRPEPSAASPAGVARLRPGLPAESGLSQEQPAMLPASGPPEKSAPTKATIYDWNPGSGQPRVVWIVDRSLDI